MRSQDLGGSAPSWKALHMRLYIIIMPREQRKIVHLICHHTQPNSSRFNHWMVLIHGLDSSTSLSLHSHSKRQASKDSLPSSLSKSTQTLPLQIRVLHFIGPAYQSSMTRLRLSLGLIMTNLGNAFTGILLPSFLLWPWDCLQWLLLILYLQFLPSTFLRLPSSAVATNCFCFSQ